MKASHAIMVLSVLMSLTAQAATDQLYRAINAPERDARLTVNGVPTVGTDIFSKSIGGLSCKKTTDVMPNAEAKFTCTLAFSEIKPKLIYDSLNLPEVDARPVQEGVPVVGTDVYAKSASGLICTKSTFVMPGAKSKYSCSVSF